VVSETSRKFAPIFYSCGTLEFMRKVLLGLAIGTAGLLSVVSSQGAVSSGLLFGYNEAGAYKTLWVAPQKGKLSLVRQGKDVLVPRKSGWWRVGSSTSSAKGLEGRMNSSQFIFANPVSSTSRGIPRKFDTECEGDETTQLLFVHEKYLAVENSSGGYCKGAAHPWAASTLQVRDLDLLERSGGTSNITNPEPNFVELTDAIDEIAQDQFYRAGDAFYKKLSAEQQETFEKSPNATNWALIRRNGQWVIRGRLGYAYEAVRGACCIDFDTGVTPTAALVGHDTLAVPWKTLQSQNKNIIDAFSSPQKDVLFTLEKKQLTAFAVQNGKIGAVLLKVPFKGEVSPVMIQWANAASVTRWTGDIGKFLK
jgi:hypothetical protein